MGKNLKFTDLTAQKALVDAKARQMEQGFITSVIHPERIVLGIGSSLLQKVGVNQKLLSIIPKTGNGDSIITNIIRNTLVKSSGAFGFLGRVLAVFNNPIITGLLVRNRRAWMKWQLVNVGFIVLGFFLKRNKNKR